jgi:hypothetical protein
MSLYKDGNDYHVIESVCLAVKDIDGLICELGINRGGGIELLINTFNSFDQKRIFVGIDPYGDIPYADIGGVRSVGYDNNVKSMFLKDIYNLCHETNTYFLFYNMTDVQFFKRFYDGVPVYKNCKETIVDDYALVIIDGPHTTEAARLEFEFFNTRVVSGGIIIFDDIEQYPHMESLDEYIRSQGFEHFQITTYKAAYRKL